MSLETNTRNTDVSREWLTWAKLIHLFTLLFGNKTLKVLQPQEKFSTIDFDSLWNDGKRGMILDVDDCIAPHHGHILPENIVIIQKLLEKEWKIVIFSNMKKTDRYQDIESLGIHIMTSQYAKPDIRGFEQCLSHLELPAEQVIMVGDNYVTDGGSMDAGIDFLRVWALPSAWGFPSFGRIVQVSIRGSVAFLLEFYNQKQ